MNFIFVHFLQKWIDTKSLEKHGHHAAGRLHQGVAAAGQAPVIDQGPLAHGIDPNHLTDGDIPTQFPSFLPLQHDPAQDFKVGAVVIQQMLFAPGDELGGVQPCQQIEGDGVLDHGK